MIIPFNPINIVLFGKTVFISDDDDDDDDDDDVQLVLATTWTKKWILYTLE